MSLILSMPTSTMCLLLKPDMSIFVKIWLSQQSAQVRHAESNGKASMSSFVIFISILSVFNSVHPRQDQNAPLQNRISPSTRQFVGHCQPGAWSAIQGHVNGCSHGCHGTDAPWPGTDSSQASAPCRGATAIQVVDSLVRLWLCARVPDLQSGGCRFESRSGLLRTKVYSAFHPSGVGKCYQL